MKAAEIDKLFKNHNLVIKKKAISLLIEYCSQDPGDEEEKLKAIINEILNLSRPENDVSVDLLKEVIQSIHKQQSLTEKVCDFQNAFDCPKYEFDASKVLIKSPQTERSCLGKGRSKIDFQKERFEIMKYSLLQSKLFSKSLLKFRVDKDDGLTITNIIELNQKPPDEVVVIIGIIDINGGTYTLEDETGVVNVSIGKECQHGDDMFPIGCIVIVQGTAQVGFINAMLIGHPPPLTYPDFINKFWTMKEDPFGWGITQDAMSQLHRLLVDVHQGALILTFSDLWIDVPSVVDQFNHVLSQYDKFPPNMIILCGSFTSKPYPFNKMKEFERLFKKFVAVISVHTEIMNNTEFVFVPSPTDLAAPKIFPRPPLPELVQRYFEKAHFMTNPCKVRFLDKTITIFRDDLMSRLSRCSLMPIPDVNEHESLLMTVLRQAHLTPTDINHTPVSWEYDHAMRLFPAPDILILADSSAPWSTEQDGTKAFNPGCFGNGGSYCAYFPARGEIAITTL